MTEADPSSNYSIFTYQIPCDQHINLKINAARVSATMRNRDDPHLHPPTALDKKPLYPQLRNPCVLVSAYQYQIDRFFDMCVRNMDILN